MQLCYQIASVWLALERGQQDEPLRGQSAEAEAETWVWPKRLRGQLDVAVATEADDLDLLQSEDRLKSSSFVIAY